MLQAAALLPAVGFLLNRGASSKGRIPMKHVTIAALASAAVLLAGVAWAQAPDFSKVEIKTTDLGHNTYMLEGQGGNITVAGGTAGSIRVDTQFAPLHDKIKAAIAKISPLPVKYVINTHYHGDHVDGNALFRKAGATIGAHDNLDKPTEAAAYQPAPQIHSTERSTRRA